MAITRKQAILALLGAPIGIVGAQGRLDDTAPEVTVTYSYGVDMEMHLPLTDIKITHNGQTKRISAREIWEALG